MRILFVFLNNKTIYAADFIDNKKRIVLNKERELRLTKAGGFAQKKYQNFVKKMRDKPEGWWNSEIQNKNLFNRTYDKSIIVSDSPELAREIMTPEINSLYPYYCSENDFKSLRIDMKKLSLTDLEEMLESCPSEMQ